MSSLFILENSIDLFYVVTNQDGKIVTNNELFKNYVSHIQPSKITDIISIEGDKEDFIKAIESARKHAPEPSRVYARTRQKNTSDRYNVWNCFAIGETLHFVGIQIVDVTSTSRFSGFPGALGSCWTSWVLGSRTPGKPGNIGFEAPQNIYFQAYPEEAFAS